MAATLCAAQRRPARRAAAGRRRRRRRCCSARPGPSGLRPVSCWWAWSPACSWPGSLALDRGLRRSLRRATGSTSAAWARDHGGDRRGGAAGLGAGGGRGAAGRRGRRASAQPAARRSAVTAVTIAAQALAVTPGGIGTYEAAATAALVAARRRPGHGVRGRARHARGEDRRTRCWPAGWRSPSRRRRTSGRLRLPAGAPAAAAGAAAPHDAPVVVLVPVHDEAGSGRRACCAGCRRPVRGRPVRVLVVDDGSGRRLRRPGRGGRRPGGRAPAQPGPRRRGARAGWPRRAALRPGRGRLPRRRRRVRPGGPRRGGRPGPGRRGRLRGRLPVRRPDRADAAAPPARQPGAHPLAALVARRSAITDGQSGYRAFSPRGRGRRRDRARLQLRPGADAGPAGQGLRATPRCRSGTPSASPARVFVTPRALPAQGAAGGAPPSWPPTPVPAQSSTTWRANLLRAADHAAASSEPSGRSAATAS